MVAGEDDRGDARRREVARAYGWWGVDGGAVVLELGSDERRAGATEDISDGVGGEVERRREHDHVREAHLGDRERSGQEVCRRANEAGAAVQHHGVAAYLA